MIRVVANMATSWLSCLTTMKTVKIAELKNRLSYYLRRVQRGESILVCDRDRVVARIYRVDTGVHWAERHPQGRTLHTLDQPLAIAARRKGFLVPD